MQTHIKLTPHVLDNLQKILGLFKKILILFKKCFLVKNMIIQKKHWFYSIQFFWKTCVFSKQFDQSFVPSKNLQPNTFPERFSHANVNELDDWRASSHCKTFGLIFRKWIGMGSPKWSIKSGLDCIFLQIGLRKKNK